jgi:uncharacterized protein YjbI with pentapeptide repeats
MPTKPFVIPRAVLPNNSVALPIVDALIQLLERKDFKTIQVTGFRAFEGLEWALEEIRSLIHPPPVELCLLRKDHQYESVLLTVAQGHASTTLDFQPWGVDEIIEYLLAKYPDHCQHVMSVIQNEVGDIGQVNAELWTQVIDRLIECGFSKSIQDLKMDLLRESLSLPPRDPFRVRSIEEIARVHLVDQEEKSHLASRLTRWTTALLDDHDLYNALLSNYLVSQLEFLAFKPKWTIMPTNRGTRKRLFSRLWLRFSFRTVTPFRIIRVGDPAQLLRVPIPLEVIRMASDRLNAIPEIRAMLLRKLEIPECTATVASLLFGMDADWKPGQRPAPWSLRQASFAGAKWRQCHFDHAKFFRIDLSNADMNRGSFEDAAFEQVSAISSNWSNGNMIRSLIMGSQFSISKLERCQFKESDLHACDFTDAVLEHSNFRRSKLYRCVLKRTSCRFVNFAHTRFLETILDRCDFSFASLKFALLVGIDLRSCIFESTNLSMARMGGCNLEGQLITKSRFYRAMMVRCMMTGTRFRDLDMRRANFTESRLGEIEWTDCDLRECDFRGCTFHFGSTRCGMVGSPYPSHGTRTGFYSDDLERLYYESPESVRRGNMQGCDLRGANIEGVDFYLIDLRGAKLDPWQRRQMGATGAILDDLHR